MSGFPSKPQVEIIPSPPEVPDASVKNFAVYYAAEEKLEAVSSSPPAKRPRQACSPTEDKGKAYSPTEKDNIENIPSEANRIAKHACPIKEDIEDLIPPPPQWVLSIADAAADPSQKTVLGVAISQEDNFAINNEDFF
jgi:hypothetical protein